MKRTIKDIQTDIEQLGIKGGYDIEQLLTPQDCRRLSYEIERLNNIINNIENDLLDRYYGRGKYSLSTDIVGIPTFYKKIKELKGSDK